MLNKQQERTLQGIINKGFTYMYTLYNVTNDDIELSTYHKDDLLDYEYTVLKSGRYLRKNGNKFILYIDKVDLSDNEELELFEFEYLNRYA